MDNRNLLNRNLLKRYAYLNSLLEDTDSFLGTRDIGLIHVDSSLMLFDPRLPNPWLSDEAQVTWLLSNHDQVEHHGHSFMRRIFGFPKGSPYTLDEQRIFRATVRAVLHLQMFEGIRVAVLPVPPGTQLERLNFSLLSDRHHRIAWAAWHYYESIETSEARRATGTELQDVVSRYSQISGHLQWLAPYRPEHFERGIRIALPESWRRFLYLLHNGRCADCNRHVRSLGHIDHMRPVKPEESPFHAVAAGNSVLFNLSLLCPRCNLRKSNSFKIAPEELLPRIAPNPRILEYLRLSLGLEPTRLPHRLSDVQAPAGEEHTARLELY